MVIHGFYFDQTRCTNCLACVVACKDWHDVPPGPVRWISVNAIEEGRYPNLNVSFLVRCCYHCLHPRCVEACPTRAIQKREDNGVVIVDNEACLGRDSCGLCAKECPYDAPQFGEEENAKMQKCDLCFERLMQGLKPVCVGACPMRALDAGPMEELEEKYGGGRTAEGFVLHSKLTPSILFKPKPKSPRSDR